MSENENESTERFETREEAVKSEGTDVRAWLTAIRLARKTEKKWRDKVEEAFKIYSSCESKKNPFNILFSNTNTMIPAVYNSEPAPDIRERYSTGDDVSKEAARISERAVSFTIDQYGLHETLQSVVFDVCLRGRGVPRVRYEPEFGQEIDPITFEPYQVLKYQKTTCELVEWDDLVIGPAKTWNDVPWVAFRHLMSREQIVKLNPQIGPLVPLGERVNGCDDKTADSAPSLFKRAEVWEVWDKEENQVLFITKTYDDDALLKTEPQFKLSGFFPIPRPVYAIRRTGTLEPIVPYATYDEQAEELNIITKRIKSLIKCLKWRGVYVKGFEAFAEMQECDDGEFKPSESDFQIMSGMGLKDAVMVMPIDILVGVIDRLAIRAEQVKQSIFEISGISDILRGQTKATETLGAQQIKAQWGSLRISDLQADIQRLAKDVIQMIVEIITEQYEPAILMNITQTEVTPEISEIMKDDMTRRYKIDVETDSTIRADLSRSQENISQFVTGFGSFITSIGPAVQAGFMSPTVAVDLLSSFSRVFKLGRQAEDALEQMKTDIEQKQAQQPPSIPQAPQQGLPQQQEKAMWVTTRASGPAPKMRDLG